VLLDGLSGFAAHVGHWGVALRFGNPHFLVILAMTLVNDCYGTRRVSEKGRFESLVHLNV